MRLSVLVTALALPAILSAQTPEELFRQGKLEDAKAAAQALLAKNKNDLTGIFWMGRVADEQNKMGDAINWFEKAVKLNDTSAVYHMWLGNALGGEAQNASKIRQPFLARRVKSEFERAVQLDPRMLDPRFGLVDFYTMAPGFMGGSIDKAKEQAVAIGKLHPYRGHYAEARIAQRQKDVAAEGKAYEAALAAAKVAAPDSTSPYYSLAAYYRRQSRFDDAFAVYDSLMRRKPDEVPVHASYGYVASLSGKNLERGERELKTWLAGPPKDASTQTISFVRYHLGQIYEKTSRKELARTEYTEAVKQNPQNADAKKALNNLK
jgi:tetratricopeptide (TPR) repeat protein